MVRMGSIISVRRGHWQFSGIIKCAVVAQGETAIAIS